MAALLSPAVMLLRKKGVRAGGAASMPRARCARRTRNSARDGPIWKRKPAAPMRWKGAMPPSSKSCGDRRRPMNRRPGSDGPTRRGRTRREIWRRALDSECKNWGLEELPKSSLRLKPGISRTEAPRRLLPCPAASLCRLAPVPFDAARLRFGDVS